MERGRCGAVVSRRFAAGGSTPFPFLLLGAGGNAPKLGRVVAAGGCSSGVSPDRRGTAAFPMVTVFIEFRSMVPVHD